MKEKDLKVEHDNEDDSVRKVTSDAQALVRNWVFTMPNVNPTSMSLANSQNWLNYWKHASRMMINSVV